MYTPMRKEKKTLKSGEEVRRFAEGTVLKTHKILHKALEQAVVWEKIAKNPAKTATPPKDDDREVGYWSYDEGYQFLALIREEFIYRPCFITFYTGLRIGEVLALTWDNVDLERGVIFVRKNIIWDEDRSEWQVVPKVKTKRSKDNVYLPEVLTKFLREEKERQEKEQITDREDNLPSWPMEYVCRGGIHPFMTPSYVSQRFTKPVDRHSMRKITFHGLRHTHATMLFESGATSQEISKRLRHTRVSTTDEIYIHVDEDMKRKTAEILDRSPRGHHGAKNGEKPGVAKMKREPKTAY